MSCECEDEDANSRDRIRWAYRLFLDREPESEQAFERMATGTADLRREFLASSEFQAKNPDLSLSIDKWVIVPTAFGFRIFVALNEFGISRPILLDQYETSAVRLFQSMVKPGDRVIDVGANIGFHAMLFCQLVGPSGEVVAFEPVKYLYQALSSSIRENGFEPRCRAYNCAVADRPGLGTIRHALRTTNFGGGHLAATRADDDHSYDEVEIKVLDDFMSEKRCSLIKIDVEGAETKVLRGGVERLS
jgi:FkbM family methyltransferase